MKATTCDCGTVRKAYLRPLYYCFRCRSYYDFIKGRWVRRQGATRPLPFKEGT